MRRKFVTPATFARSHQAAQAVMVDGAGIVPNHAADFEEPIVVVPNNWLTQDRQEDAMRIRLVRFVMIIWAIVGLAPHGAAQTVARPTIHNVTLHQGEGVLTITGIGLGRGLVVTVDGQPVTVLPGGTETQIEVLAPAALVTTPGTYRLTVVDPVRQVGDAFVVASQAATLAFGGAALNGLPAAAPGTATALPGPSAIGPEAGAVQRPRARAVSPAVFEGACKTAIGFNALASNTTGCFNTASGYDALALNSSGDHNTASGDLALLFNTTGSFNTASGSQALYSNTTGNDNTATGFAALVGNTTGFDNTANGYEALKSNTTGFQNTASGLQALGANSTGFQNTASGLRALGSNTTGYWNTASGYNTLASNTTGYDNTASGIAALSLNVSGHSNTAFGIAALYNNTIGAENAALGHDAGANATTGSYNVFIGAGVTGTAADTNTIRIGLPYTGGVGQNKTFIAGIRDTQLTGSAVQVFIDANGQLGTLTPGVQTGTVTIPLQQQLRDQQQQLRDEQQLNHDQQAVIADLRARLARLEALLSLTEGGK